MENPTPVVAAATGRGVLRDRRTKTSRVVPQISEYYNNKCLCLRSKTIVFCRACRFYCNGRMRMSCEVHPNVTFLMDITVCPQCHSSMYLDEYFKI